MRYEDVFDRDGEGALPPVLAAKLAAGLGPLWREYLAHLATDPEGGARTFSPSDDTVRIDEGRIAIDATAAGGSGRTLLSLLEARYGLEDGAFYKDAVSGWLPLDRLGDLDDIADLAVARPVRPVVNVGIVENQGDAALRADVIRSDLGLDGSGLRIGILSDSFNTSFTATTSYLDDILSGDLPPGIEILDDSIQSGTIDEGRAMAQLIHDIVPGAELLFHTAFGGVADFASGIVELADAGADIIVDDVGYLDRSFFQDGPIGQAVDEVFSRGVAYFSAAGNSGRQSYESDFRPVDTVLNGFDGTWHDFDPGAGTDLLQQFTITPQLGSLLSFQWDQPYLGNGAGSPGASSDLDVWFFEADGDLIGRTEFDNVGADPFEIFGLETTRPAGEVVNVAFSLESGPAPEIIKYIDFEGATENAEFATRSGSSFGHPNAEGGLGVGASAFFFTPEFGQAPPLLNSFSSAGGTPILFEPDGTPTFEIRERVDITAVDGVNNTFFGQESPDDPDSFPNFFGTSAAAPNAAAVAAQLLQLVPEATPSDIYAAMREGTIDILQRNTGEATGPGFDDDSGNGLLQADLALEALVNALGFTPNEVTGSTGRDVLTGTDGLDFIDGLGGSFDVVSGLAGRDTFEVGSLVGNGARDILLVRDFEEGEFLSGVTEADVAITAPTRNGLLLRLEGSERDLVLLNGIDGLEDVEFGQLLV